MIVAGGTASSLLADFGGEVVKVERPAAATSAQLGTLRNGVSLVGRCIPATRSP